MNVDSLDKLFKIINGFIKDDPVDCKISNIQVEYLSYQQHRVMGRISKLYIRELSIQKYFRSLLITFFNI